MNKESSQWEAEIWLNNPQCYHWKKEIEKNNPLGQNGFLIWANNPYGHNPRHNISSEDDLIDSILFDIKREIISKDLIKKNLTTR